MGLCKENCCEEMRSGNPRLLIRDNDTMDEGKSLWVRQEKLVYENLSFKRKHLAILKEIPTILETQVCSQLPVFLLFLFNFNFHATTTHFVINNMVIKISYNDIHANFDCSGEIHTLPLVLPEYTSSSQCSFVT